MTVQQFGYKLAASWHARRAPVSRRRRGPDWPDTGSGSMIRAAACETASRERTATAALSRRLNDLETERARMAAILSGMVEGVLVVDGDGRLRLVNDAAQRMLNLDSTCLGATTSRPCASPGRRPARRRAQRRATAADRSAARCVVAGGPAYFPRASDARNRQGGGAVLVLHDISDLRRVDRVRRDFVANVSHELRTPLTAVRGYVEALMDEPVEPEQRRKIPRGDRSPHRTDGAPGPRPAAAGAPRRAAGDG